MYRKQTWTMRQYAGYASAKESNERYRYLLSKGSTGLSMAFDLPTQLGLDSDNPRCQGEVGSHGRGDRHDRRHAHRLRLHPARRGLDVDDDQRPGGLPAAAVRAGRRGAGRALGEAARHDPERRAQGVHRARQLHLPADPDDAPDHRHLPVLPGTDPPLEHDLDLRLSLPREGLLGRPGGRVHALLGHRLRPGRDRQGPVRRRLRPAPGVLLQRPQQRLPGGRQVPRRAAHVGAHHARALRRRRTRRRRCSASTRRPAA